MHDLDWSALEIRSIVLYLELLLPTPQNFYYFKYLFKSINIHEIMSTRKPLASVLRHTELSS